MFKIRRLRITNPLLSNNYKTYLNAAYSSGVALTVKSNVSFAANDLLVVGEPTEEFAELKKLDSISGSVTLNLPSALNFAHNKETPVYKSLWDNISIEGRSSSAGVFAEITQSAIQWDNKNNETVYFHSSGDDNWEYRFRFYNSVTTTYSEYSPTITGAQPGRKTVRYMVIQVRKTVQDELRKLVTDQEIIRFFNRAQEIIYAHNPRYWFLYIDTYKGASGIASVANQSVYDLDTYTTFGHLDSIRYKYTSGGTNLLYHLKKMPDVEFDARVRDLNKTTDDWVKFYKLLPADSSSDMGYFQVDPTPKNAVGTFYPNYYEKMADLSLISDSTQVPIPSILEDFAISQILRIKGDEQRANLYETQFYGPEDRNKDTRKLTGMALLDELDDQQKRSQKQIGELIRFRGQKAGSRFFGEDTSFNADQIRENYF